MPTRDFQDVLTDLDEGRVHEQLTEMLPQVVQAVMETGKKGSLTLTITITKENRMAVVSAKAESKLPRAKTDTTLFFATDDGVLTKNDPKQQPLPFKSSHGVALDGPKVPKKPEEN